MEPLTVEIDSPSSSATMASPLPRKNGSESYEVVDYNEVKLPDFQHLKRLGRGTYGTVVECMFRGKPAAAKLVENGNDLSPLRSEAELLHGFRHKNIIKLYALFHGEMSGLVLELMEGRSLSELLHQHKHITFQACHVLHWAMQLCEALCYLHAHNFIHRDIKPSNMLLSRNYKTLKLCDFGTVAELKTTMTDNRGTAAWMAPEVFRGRRYDQKCDIFSLGISLWEMITRQQPFTNLSETNPMTLLWKVAENGLRPPKIEDLPGPLMELIERCWQNDPDERPFLEEVQKTIEAFIEIFPNANLLPLVDRTTAKQALAESSWDRQHQRTRSQQQHFQHNSGGSPSPYYASQLQPAPAPPPPPSQSTSTSQQQQPPKTTRTIIIQQYPARNGYGSPPITDRTLQSRNYLQPPPGPSSSAAPHQHNHFAAHPGPSSAFAPAPLAPALPHHSHSMLDIYQGSQFNATPLTSPAPPPPVQPSSSSLAAPCSSSYQPCLSPPVHAPPDNYASIPGPSPFPFAPSYQTHPTASSGTNHHQQQLLQPPCPLPRTVSEPVIMDERKARKPKKSGYFRVILNRII